MNVMHFRAQSKPRVGIGKQTCLTHTEAGFATVCSATQGKGNVFLSPRITCSCLSLATQSCANKITAELQVAQIRADWDGDRDQDPAQVPDSISTPF